MKLAIPSLFSAPILLFFIFLSHSAFPSNTNALVKIGEPKTPTVSKEKIYIHFDKAFYNLGENVWYKVYLVDAINHESVTLSKVVYVDLIDPNNIIIDSKIIKVNEGSGKGDFKLPVDIIDGAYTIRAYTNFMRNFDDSYFFRKKIRVNSLKPNNDFTTDATSAQPHISFFPEGDHIISGFINRIAFKATNYSGKGIYVKGEIIDNTNNKVLHFETSKFGLGSFQFIPEKGKKYTARISHNGTKHSYFLQPVINNGATIRIDEAHNGYRVNVYSSLPNGMDNFELVGMQKGDIVCRAKLNGGNPEAAVNIPKSNLEYGLIQFQLLNKKGTILSEELAFLDSNNLEQKATVTPSKKVYETNELVEIEINFDQVLQESLKANMSISVTEVNPTEKDIYGLDIKSHLLLNPDIRDNIEQFGYNFYSNNLQRKKTLNLLLMSQEGNQHLFNKKIKDNELKFPFESGFNLKGIIKEKRNKKTAKSSVTLSYKNNKELGYDKTITDSLGRFSFNGLNFDERTFVSIKAKSLNSKKYGRDFTIELDTVLPPLVNIKNVPQKKTKKSNQFLESKIKQNRNIDFAPQKGEVKLDEVKLIANKKREERYTEKRKLSLYISPSHTLDIKNSNIIANNPLQALQGRFAGFDVIGNYIIIRGQRYYMGPLDEILPTRQGVNTSLKGDDVKPLFLVDGFPVDYDLVSSMPIFDIDFIDIIKNSQSAIYGIRGGAHIIAIYTLDGSEKNDKQNDRGGTTSFYHPGYYQARKFYQDKDNPSTLYWNPELKLEQSNTAKIAFKTANKSATYKVLLQGISSNGTPFKAEAYFDVK